MKLSRNPYGNCQVLNDLGELMFRCDNRKAIWYLKRNLAKIVSEEPYVIQLLFQPKGTGHIGDKFYLQEKFNKCVVCGVTKDLTKHHVVPQSYRKNFPYKLKSHSSYDVLVLCLNCHSKYEQYAQELRKVITGEFGLPMPTKSNQKERFAHGLANVLIKERQKIPAARIEELLNHLRVLLNKQNITDEDLETIANWQIEKSHICYDKQVVDQLDDIEAFITRWRKHFLQTMKPKHMPDHWSVERRINYVL